MTRKVIFYLINSVHSDAGLSAAEVMACQLAGQWWRNGKRVLIVCETQKQAEVLDEWLWQLDADQFVPHNLAGEGPHYGAPVELCWPGRRGNAPRDVLINLQQQIVDFVTTFYNVIDFVPQDETLKQQARERYKSYRNIGFQLETVAAPIVDNSTSMNND